jgi:hypothetical protein
MAAGQRQGTIFKPAAIVLLYTIHFPAVFVWIWTAKKTFDVLYYCRANFEQCEIYQKHRPTRTESADPAVDDG